MIEKTHHVSNKRFILYQDFQDLAVKHLKCLTRANLFATVIRVLDAKRDALVAELSQQMDENDIQEEDLWMLLTWEDFRCWCLRLFAPRGFQGIIQDVIDAGYAKRRYVLRGKHGQLLTDERGQLLTYGSWEEAKVGKKQHRGEVLCQFRYLVREVNQALAALAGGSDRPDPTGPGGTNKKEGAQRGGLPTEQPSQGEEAQQPTHKRTTSKRSSVLSSGTSNITHVSQNCETGHQYTRKNTYQGSQICEPPDHHSRKFANTDSQKGDEETRRFASNKELPRIGNESESLITNSAARAVDLSSFDFQQDWGTEAILHLARLILPPLKEKYRSEQDKQTAIQAEHDAASHLASTLWLRKRGLRHLARLLCYMSDRSSGCGWLLRHDLNAPPRLANIAKPGVAWNANREMEQADWWPDCLPRDQQSPATEHELPAVFGLKEIDLAALAGIEPEERYGMEDEEAQAWADWLHQELSPHGYFVLSKPLGNRYRPRGSAIAIEREADALRLIIYSSEQWDLVLQVEAQAELGTPEFIRLLADALRADQVA